MSFKDCVAYNSKAIHQLRAGECLEAIESIKQAFMALQPLFKQPVVPDIHMDDGGEDNGPSCDASARQSPTKDITNQGQQQPQQTSFSPYPLYPPPRMYYSVPIMEDDMVQASPLFSSDNNVFAFYPRMFEISETDGHKFGLSKAFVLLVYNFAMAHHVHGSYHHLANEEATATRQARLVALLQMYQSVIVAARGTLSPEEIGEMLCVIVASANNSGHLHGFLQDFQEVRNSLALQMDLLKLSYGPCSLPPVDFALLFSSIFVFLEGPGLSIPPAA